MRKKSTQSGFARYLKRSLRKDGQARALFFAELMKEPVSAQLRLLRRLRGLSQVELARRIHLAQPEVARLERAGSNPRARTLEKAAKGLRARLDLVPEDLLRSWEAHELRAQGERFFSRIACGSRGESV